MRATGLDAQITVRISSELRDAIQQIEGCHRISTAEFVRGLIEAGVTMYRDQGYFSFPIEVVPAKAARRLPLGGR